MSIENQFDDYESEGGIRPIDRHRAIISRAIYLAPRRIKQAMTADTYAALAFLKSDPSTEWECMQAISDLTTANKAISRKDINAGIKAVTTTSAVDQARTTLIEHVEQLVIDAGCQMPLSGIEPGKWQQLRAKKRTGILFMSIVNATYIDLADGLIATVDRNGDRKLYFPGR